MPVAGHDRFLLMFAPEVWTPPAKLKQFLGEPFQVTPQAQESIQSCTDHSRKFEALASLVNRIRPTLILDRQELESNGYSPATRSSEFAALIEVLVCELYSVLDGLRNSIYWLFRGINGVQKKSTGKLFSLAAEGKYSSEFPENIRWLLAEANSAWFLELRRLRTAFTHGGLGSCHFDSKTNMISYMNSSLGTEKGALVIEDIEALVNRLSGSVFALQQKIFDGLYEQLTPVETPQFCGIYKGRMYMRKVTPEKELSRNSGICDSNQWFENEPDYFCGLAKTCPAYHRKISSLQHTVINQKET